MLNVQLEKWQQTPETLRELALQAQHPRTRERLLALYEIARGQSATQLAYQSDRNPQTVMEWVNRYNTYGSEALTYRHSGGHPPPLSDAVTCGVDQTLRQALEVAATPPQQRTEDPIPRWTLKRLVRWVKETFRDVPLNKVPGVLIAVGCIRAAMHHWESRRLVPYFLACPLPSTAVERPCANSSRS